MSYEDINKAKNAASAAESYMKQNPADPQRAQVWVAIGNLWANIHRANGGH